MVREALAEARAELDTLRSRQSELEQQIAEAEAFLGGPPQPAGGRPNMTLHDALAQVLREGGNEGMTARDLADAVNRRALYHKRDGSPVEVNQVQARVNNYGAVFEKNDSIIRLREDAPALSATPPGVTIFRDDDDGFFEWLEAHPGGYFVNTERNPKPHYLVLHRPQCPHYKSSKPQQWTKAYVKACSADRADLEQWANDEVGGEVTLCPRCFSE